MARVTVAHSDHLPVAVDRLRETLAAEHDLTPVEIPDGRLGTPPTTELRDAVADSAALVIRPTGPSADLLATPGLRIVAIHGSGYDHVDVAAATENGVVVTHSPEAVAPAVVEQTLGTMVALLRDWPSVPNRTAAGEWGRAVGSEVGERTVGVVGLGTIGFRVARAVRAAFGADVVGHDPHVSDPGDHPIYPRHGRETVEAAGVELVGSDELFDRADLVTLHVPLTDDTRGMVDREALARLDGHLVNTARGPVVDEAALRAALDAGVVAGGAPHVRAHEPPEADDPLAGRDDVFPTPHVAGKTDGYCRRAAERAGEKVNARLAGERPPFVVNPGVFD
jgi:D-3-phosphoglycerate dehydrogenase